MLGGKEGISMSTQKQEQRWLFKNRILNLVSGKRRYTVEGHIVFVFRPPKDMFHDVCLQQAIMDTDKQFPWKDDVHPDAKREGESIFYLGDGHATWEDGLVTSCSFMINHRWDNLRRNQIYAYEKYLAKIAEECAKKKPLGSAEVRAVLEVRSVSSFKC
jgi:hypothetical protein